MDYPMQFIHAGPAYSTLTEYVPAPYLRKSFRLDELNPEYFLPKKSGVLVPYLDLLQKDLEDRPES